MSRLTIMSLAASVIFGTGLILTISTDASAYYRGGAYRGGVYPGGAYRGGYYRGVRPGVAAGGAVGVAAIGAAAAGRTTRHAADITLTHRATKAPQNPRALATTRRGCSRSLFLTGRGYLLWRFRRPLEQLHSHAVTCP